MKITLLLAIVVLIDTSYCLNECQRGLVWNPTKGACEYPIPQSSLLEFITSIEKIEDYYKGKDLKYIANIVRSLTPALSSGLFNKVYGIAVENIADNVLTASELQNARTLMAHDTNDNTNEETGVIETPLCKTITMGHVIGGIMGGLTRIREFAGSFIESIGFLLLGIPKFDTLYSVSISGDLGQSYGLFKARKLNKYLGPDGKWTDNKFILNGEASEATDAELMGDIDGAIIGANMDKLKNKKLSEILRSYYNVYASDPEFNCLNRMSLFQKIEGENTKQYLIEQVRRFGITYSKYYGLGVTFTNDDAVLITEEFWKNYVLSN